MVGQIDSECQQIEWSGGLRSEGPRLLNTRARHLLPPSHFREHRQALLRSTFPLSLSRNEGQEQWAMRDVRAAASRDGGS